MYKNKLIVSFKFNRAVTAPETPPPNPLPLAGEGASELGIAAIPASALPPSPARGREGRGGWGLRIASRTAIPSPVTRLDLNELIMHEPYADAYGEELIAFEYIERKAPFLALEMRRQGLVDGEVAMELPDPVLGPVLGMW